MENKQLVERLNDLIQLDVDAVEAYDHAIKHMEYEDIRRRFLDFRDDHRSHIRNLTEMVQHLGGKPIKSSPDLKGYLIEGFTALMSVTGSIGAMEAMKANEILTTKKYSEAAALDLPEEVKKLMMTHYSQELRHLEYIEDVITNPRHELR
jgi:uncharacterized protein (TIGR02284 family)